MIEKSPSPQELTSLRGYLSQEDLWVQVKKTRNFTKKYPRNFEALEVLGYLFFQLGQLSEAADPLGKALKLRPNNFPVASLLGYIFQQLNEPRKSEKLYRKALKIKRDSVDCLLNLGELFRTSGRLDEAVREFEQALYFNPACSEAHNNLGLALATLGHLEEAAEAYRTALQINPDLADASNNLANLLVDLGRFEEAKELYEAVLGRHPSFALAHNNYANLLMTLGQGHEAIRHYRIATTIDPNSGDSWLGLGFMLFEGGDNDESYRSLEQALRLDPHRLETRLVMGALLMAIGRLPHAETFIRETLSMHHDSAPVWTLLGDCLRALCRLKESEAAFKKALHFDPNHGAALIGLSMSMEDWGDFGAARSLALKASEKDASKAQVIAILSRVSRWNQNDAKFEAEAIDLLEAPRTSPKERAILLYSMGKYFNDLADYKEAKKYFIEANRLSQSLYPRYQDTLFSAEIDGLMRAFDNPGMGPSKHYQHPSQKPVAIIGMPRCGSSLLEQMLSSHPDLSGVGEIGFFEAMRSTRYGHRIFDLPDNDRAVLAETYLDQLSLEDGQALRVVDKTLGNIMFAGMIHQIFPEARIIHLKRHPIDTCLSIFCLDLHQVNYSTDLEHLAHAYGEYRRLMDFWRHSLPKNVLLEVSYEDLVDAPAATLRGILDFIDLPWDPACLHFSETQRRVGTSSNWQVRQGLNRSGIDRWKNYPDLSGPLLHLLE